MDPQQRLLLETSMNSLQDSSLERPGLMGREVPASESHTLRSYECYEVRVLDVVLHCAEVAVHVGMANNDWIQIQSCDSRKISPYTATGMSFSVAAGRISYALGLKGPSYIVDTACSSALVALDCSATALRKGRCTAALSAAANIMTSATTYISFSKPRMLSATGRCLTFDASADGYARGEGAGAVVLRKPNDVITSESVETSASLERCALLGVAVNQDGRSSTLTAPNGPSQHMVMMTALAEARLVPEEIVHMECHGTGTPLGDPIEILVQTTVSSFDPRLPLCDVAAFIDSKRKDWWHQVNKYISQRGHATHPGSGKVQLWSPGRSCCLHRPHQVCRNHGARSLHVFLASSSAESKCRSIA